MANEFINTTEDQARARARELRVCAEAIRMSAFRAEMGAVPEAVRLMREAYNHVIDAEWHVWGEIHAISTLPVSEFMNV